ncbi:alpha/beta fold hydrolase [Rhodobacteraceae bacterium 2CG4]|uniref:Alpha/beta fold hydrolase n=2 Tax=Halovulum marinum TaxID=2662447 RepID=A0A6L5YWD3_9RHOB|nr:alpha/beta fold hydrolase [Halovulum marinum]
MLMLRGIERWQRHPYRRAVAEPPAVWADGSSRLLDYGATPGATAPTGPVVLVVPSLINRAYVLDLTPRTSFLRALAAAGLRPLLLDWGVPGRAEARFDLEDYAARRLRPALAAAARAGGGPPALLGYCMGGTLAALQAMRDPHLRALVTIGAPWDFDAARGAPFAVRAAARQYGAARLRLQIRALADAFGLVPVTVFQHLFAMVDPIMAARKFRRFAALPEGGARAELFVALEDWLADGVPMAGPAAETLLVDWHLENSLRGARGRPSAVPPALIVTGTGDSIAQLPAAGALVRALPGARQLRPTLGHVGMITGAHAPREVWQPVVEFLKGTA